MTTVTLERAYTCWNDCRPAGCPGHIATLVYQSTADAFTFTDGKGHTFAGQTPEYDALLSMLHEMAGWNVAVASMLEAAASARPVKTAHNREAHTLLREYARFYQERIDTYQQALQEEGIVSDGKLAYAQERGMERLAEISNNLTTDTDYHVAQLRRVLTGYRQLAQRVTDVDGQGVLLVRMVEDLARRLSRLGLMRSIGDPETSTHTTARGQHT